MTNDEELFAQLLKDAAEMEVKPPATSLYICREGQAVDLQLNNKSDYSEWIKGEGADIGLHREQDTGRVCGCRLPLYHERLVVSHPDGSPIVFPDVFARLRLADSTIELLHAEPHSEAAQAAYRSWKEANEHGH